MVYRDGHDSAVLACRLLDLADTYDPATIRAAVRIVAADCDLHEVLIELIALGATALSGLGARARAELIAQLGPQPLTSALLAQLAGEPELAAERITTALTECDPDQTGELVVRALEWAVAALRRGLSSLAESVRGG